ncbi:MAG: glycosyl hydrolase family 65 protein, partial [Mycobacterium sp.]
VTGPDEYSAVADNNVYTNLMAQQNLRAAADAAARHPDRARALDIDEEETARWRAAAEAMYVPYDEILGVHQQADGFTTHQVWDFAATPADHYPLLLHYPYFDLYRKQVVKQADLVLAMHRRTDAFTPEEKAHNFAYYERLTVRDSSLSACTQAVIAAEVGHTALAYDYLGEAALMDLDDLEHNTRDELHVADQAGSWIALIAGLAGMRDQNGALTFAPRLPDALTRLAFTITMYTRCLAIEITPSAATYTLRAGEPLRLKHHEEPITVAQDNPITRPIPVSSATAQPTQPPGRTPTRRKHSSPTPPQS